MQGTAFKEKIKVKKKTKHSKNKTVRLMNHAATQQHSPRESKRAPNPRGLIAKTNQMKSLSPSSKQRIIEAISSKLSIISEPQMVYKETLRQSISPQERFNSQYRNYP